MIEREVKLAAWPGFTLPDLDGVAPGARTRRRETVDLDATYYDTRDLRLFRRGITLRHRRRGPRATWTLKLPADGDGPDGGLVRDEIEVVAAGDDVPGDLALLVAAHVRTAPLRRVAHLTTVRRRTLVSDSDGPLAEIDDDEVSIMDGGRVAARFRELEVEIPPGVDEAVAVAVVARLAEAGAEVGEPEPKVARALGPRGQVPPEATAAPSSEDPTAGEVVTAALRRSVTRLLDQHSNAVRGEDPEGVHQMRTAARRLRSDLRTFRPLLDREVTDPLRSELKELGRILGDVRDPDVLGQRLRDGASRSLGSDDGSIDGVLARLDADRDRAVARLRVALGSERYRLLLDALVAVAEDPPLVGVAGDPAASALPPLVRRPWKELRSMVADLDDEPDDDALHTVRKQAKQVRYAADAARPAVGKAATKAAKRVRAVQDVLGEHQDAVEAEAWLRSAAARPGLAPEVTFVLGALVAEERTRRRSRRDEWPTNWDKAADPDRWDWL